MKNNEQSFCRSERQSGEIINGGRPVPPTVGINELYNRFPSGMCRRSLY